MPVNPPRQTLPPRRIRFLGTDHALPEQRVESEELDRLLGHRAGAGNVAVYPDHRRSFMLLASPAARQYNITQRGTPLQVTLRRRIRVDQPRAGVSCTF